MDGLTGNIIVNNEIAKSQIVTDVGLNIPEDCTEEQFFEAGKTLANIEHGTQWAIGDWYNRIPWGDKEAACKKAGLNYKVASFYGQVANAFEIPMRVGILTFDHYKTIAINDLTGDQRQHLIAQAVHGKWSSKKLKEERDKVIGNWVEPISVDSSSAISEFVGKVADNVPDKYKKEVTKAAEKVGRQLANDYESAVKKKVDEQVKAQKEQVKSLKNEAQLEFDRAIRLKTGVKAFMTPEEFKLIRSCLHPDQAPEKKKERYAKAFNIFLRLEETTGENIKV